MDFELTVKHAVAAAIQELQDKGLLLTQSQMDEYRQLKENAADRLITGAAAAKILNVSGATITQLRKQQLIKGQWIGRRFKYKLSEIERYAKRAN